MFEKIKELCRLDPSLIVGAALAVGDFEINTSWKRAYIALADAANTLDALMARSEEEKKKMDVSQFIKHPESWKDL